MSNVTRTLQYLVDAVQEELGDAKGFFTPELLERFVNEAQAKLEPDHLQELVSALAWADDATTVALPADLYDITRIVPGADYWLPCLGYRQHGLSLYFDPQDTVYAFTGTLFYRAHYPEITSTADCLLPVAAADSLVSYSLYKCFNRIAADRAMYKRYATLTQNGVTVADLLGKAQNHLADFNDARSASGRPAPPSFFGDE